MALEATHIKFALDLQDEFIIQDLDKYIAGTVYPDSRYVTKIDRKLTHPDIILDSSEETGDFKKGWLVHLLSDKYLNELVEEQFPEVLKNLPKGWGSEHWIGKTAIKNLLDIEIMDLFNIQPYLSMLDQMICPNDEAKEKMADYIQIIKDLYLNRSSINIEDIKKMWQGLGLGDNLLASVIEKTHEFQSNKNIFNKIQTLYPLLLKKYARSKSFS